MRRKNQLATLEAQLVAWLRVADDGDCRPSHRRIWLMQGTSRIFLRKAKRLIGNDFVNCLDIANVWLAERQRGRGRFRSFVALAINACPWEAIVIDQVQNERLAQHLRTEGWYEETGKGAPCFYFFKHPRALND